MSARYHRFQRATYLTMMTGMFAAGCATTGTVHPESYDLQLRIAPETSELTATAKLHCRLTGDRPANPNRNLCIDLDLNPALTITDVRCTPARVRRVRKMRTTEAADAPPRTTHRIVLDGSPESFELAVKYHGKLWQDISAGEQRGAIHNFGVSAHIGTDGVHLGGGYWYPVIPDDSGLSRFRVSIEPREGYTFVSSAGNRADDAGDDRLHFESDFPQTDLAVVGGRFRTWRRDVDGVRFAILLREDSADDETLARRADVFLSAAVDYMRRYQPLVGPYPYDDFTIVENFFSSGFAYPTFTLLGPAVIAMEQRALRHGYLDHELLHSWWGNSVYVDPEDGNWCEALTSFAANLHGHVLDGDPAGARKARRDVCNVLTRIPADKDRPLATFGADDGAGRSIGYQKGSLVFHMLARTIGEENFWSAMRALTADYTGRYAGWRALRAVCEQASKSDLQPFFNQWVHGAGAPRFTLADARTTDDPTLVGIDIVQDGEPFDVNLPLRIHNGDGTTRDIIVPVAGPRTTVPLRDIIQPAEIELDPDYHVVRKLAGDEILPTLAGSLRGDCGVVVRPEGELWPSYDLFMDDVMDKRKTDSTAQTSVPNAEQLRDCTLILIGDAVRQPDVQALLEQSESPIKWTPSGFSIDGEVFEDPSHAVLCTVRHPANPGATITIYCGNSPAALSNAGILWFYGNSLLVYESPEAGTGGRASVVLRRDFERTQRIRLDEGLSAPPPDA